MGDLDVDGRIISKRILQKESVKMSFVNIQ